LAKKFDPTALELFKGRLARVPLNNELKGKIAMALPLMLVKLTTALTLLVAIEILVGIAAVRADDITIKIALSSSGDHIFNKMSALMVQEVEKRLPGRIHWQIFGDSRLGGDSTIMKGLMLGTHMLTMNGSWFQNIQPQFGIFDAPFLFNDREQAKKVITAVQADLARDILSKGIVLLGIGDLGFREVSNNVRPISIPADLKGIKLRVPGNASSIDTFRMLGANPTPMDIGTLYMGLREGVVDGQENPLQSIWSYKFHEVQKYISITNHVFSVIFVGASSKYWNTWPTDVQQAIRAATQMACDFSFEEDAKQQQALRKEIQEANPNILFNTADFAAFQQAVQPLYGKLEQTTGSTVWKKAIAALR
jgi:TRAP-type transport system periplasmic protein